MKNKYTEVQDVLSKPLKFTEERNARVKNEVCSIFNLKWDSIISKNRRIDIIEARRLYCVVLRRIFSLPLMTIGRFVNTNHASVIHAVKKHDIYSEVYDSYKSNFDRIKIKLVDESSYEYFLDELKYLERQKNNIQTQIDNLVLTTKKIN